MKNDIKEYDTYCIQRNGIITDFDQKVLFRLYQPIIGHIATCLYLTLFSESGLSKIVSANTTHRRLFSIMQISKSEFLNARKKLESIGLLSTKIKENENKIALDYLYLLQSPKSPNEFFKDNLLNSLLLESLGEDEFYRTQYFYSDNPLSNEDYVDISSSFEESFTILPKSIKNLSPHFSEKTTQNVISNFDMNAFIMKMTEYLIPKSLFTVSVKKEIIRIKVLFDLDEKVLEKCFLAAIEVDENNKKKVNLHTFNQVVEEMSKDNPEDDHEKNDLTLFADHLDTADPYDYYKGLLQVPALFKDDIYLIKQLQDMNIQNGIINSVLYYCMNNKKNSLNFKGYVNKVISSVVKEKCQNAYQTILYLKKGQKNNLNKNIEKKVENEIKEETIQTNDDNDMLAKIINEWGK